MTEKPTLYTRSGRKVTAYSFNGKTPYTVEQRPCGRCGGAGGSDAWKYTGYTCYGCGGTGRGSQAVLKLYTAEKLAQLNATAEKKAARKRTAAEAKAAQAAQIARERLELAKADYGRRFPGLMEALMAARVAAEAEPAREGFLADLGRKLQAYGYLSEAQLQAAAKSIAETKAKAERATLSRHVGTLGERIERTVTVERVREYQRARFYSYGRDTHEIARVYGFRDAVGNALVAFARDLGVEEGQEVIIRGTIKEHGAYQGEAQTTLARVNIKEEKP